MNPHPRIRKTIKWGGAVVTVLLVVVWIGSESRFIGYTFANGDWLGIASGTLQIGRWVGATRGFTCVPLKEFEVFWFFNNVSTPGRPIPLWWPLTASHSALIAALLANARASRRARAGHCPKSRYDLVGLARGSLCPECGNPPA